VIGLVQCKFCEKELQKKNRIFCNYSCSAKYREQNKSPEMKQILATNHSLKMKKIWTIDKRKAQSQKMIEVNEQHPEYGHEHSKIMKDGFAIGKYKPNSGCFKQGNKVNLGKSIKLGTKKSYIISEQGRLNMKLGAEKRVKWQRESDWFVKHTKKQVRAMNKYHADHPEMHSIIGAKGLAKLAKKNETYIEQKMRKNLQKNNIEFIRQNVILFPKIHKWCIVDFEIPSKKLIIECDGERWHQDKEKDLLREQRILSQPKYEKYEILRFSGKEIRNDIDMCINKILNI